jgi:solute carrier family 25 citrate transporter 1
MTSEQQQKQQEEKTSTPAVWKRLTAGAVAGLADVWTCHGLDRVKTHMQQNVHFTILQAFKDIYNKGGIAAVYEGVLPMSLEAIVKVATRFYVFTYAHDVWKTKIQSDPNAKVGVTGTVISGAAAGAVESLLIVIPCELLKVRHMTHPDHASFFTVFKQTIQNEGFLTLYKGGASTLLRQVTNQMIRFPIFYQITNYLKSDVYKTDHLPAAVNLSAGAFAGMVSTFANTPLDTIKTRIQKQGQTLNTVQVCQQIYRDGGIRAFWAGVIPRSVRVVPGQAITFYVYEKVMHLLKNF